MPRMIDLLRVSALPSNVVMAASKGSLSVPPREMVEILVHLAVHNKIFAQQAQLTLAGWDEAVSRTVAADPTTTREVLDYMISPKNLRPVLLPALLSNPSVSQQSLIELSETAPADIAEVMLKSERIRRSDQLRAALESNPNVLQAVLAREPEPAPATAAPEASAPETASVPDPVISDQEIEVRVVEDSAVPVAAVPDEILPEPAVAEASLPDEVLDQGIHAYLAEHTAELAAESDKPFQPIGGIHEERIPEAEEPLAQPVAKSSGTGAAAAVKRAPVKKTFLSAKEERGSALQKISKLDVKGRIQLAMKGNKEERSLLIRDGTKVVALAVLESPKISDGEVERFASQKNVLEAVLRGIPLKRRFAKNYAIIRNLVFNPRTPLDLSLGLVKNLLASDLRNLAGNKEVSDTVRKLALKMFKQKLNVRK